MFALLSTMGLATNGEASENKSKLSLGFVPILQRLQVPNPLDSWKIDSYFGTERVVLELPKDLLKIDTLPQEIRSSLEQRIEFRRRNIEVLRKAAIETDRILQKGPITHFAEYKQRLNLVVMSLPPSRENSYGSPIALHEPVLKALPDYTKVEFFLQEGLIPQVANRLQKLGLKQHVKLHGEKEYEFIESGISLRHHTTRWMRDLFWTASKQDGKSLLILPLAFYQINDLSRPDNDYITKLEDPQHQVIRVPLFFKGGNFLVGSVGKKRILFVGEDELQLNQNFYYNAFFYFPPPEEVLELLKQLIGADEVRVLPNSKHLFHLDMVMSAIKPGVMAIIEPVDTGALDADDQRVITEARQMLAENGFRIVGVPTLADWINTFKSPVNIVPFTNRNNGRLSALVPQFEDKWIMIRGESVSIQKKIQQSYMNAGVSTIFATSEFFKFGGNFHCAILPVE
jgi:hypothetical protein